MRAGTRLTIVEIGRTVTSICGGVLVGMFLLTGIKHFGSRTMAHVTPVAGGLMLIIGVVTDLIARGAIPGGIHTGLVITGDLLAGAGMFIFLRSSRAVPRGHDG